MPATRNQKCRNTRPSPPPTPPKKRRSPRKRYGPFGPYSAADRELDGMTRVEAVKHNDERISRILEVLAGKARTCHHSLQHRMSAPRLSTGKTDRLDAGSASKVHLGLVDTFIGLRNDLTQAFYLRATFWNNKNNVAPPARPLPEIRPFPSLSPLNNSPSPPPIASTSQRVLDRPFSRNNTPDIQATVFDKSLGVTLMAWTKNNARFVEMVLYPREDARVRLSDFKVLLGSKGIEQTQDIEIYHFGHARWLPALWNTPHIVPSRGHALLMRYADVTHLDDFEHHLPWLSAASTSAIVTPPPTDHKGKAR
ncbi:hypothetical protein BDZ97DRAFT_1926212 [Flammula alnicola]|nr:hypothetical protein BDZ97DRAFT_1926212 [Flammula alnicola]